MYVWPMPVSHSHTCTHTVAAYAPPSCSQVFDKLVGPRGMLRGATRVLVTHAVQYLSQADQVIVLHKGAVAASGTLAELKALLQDKGSSDDATRKRLRAVLASLLTVAQEGGARSDAGSEMDERSRAGSVSRDRAHTATAAHHDSSAGRIMTKETQAIGAVDSKVYKAYIRHGGGWGWCALLFFGFVVERLAFVGTDW